MTVFDVYNASIDPKDPKMYDVQNKEVNKMAMADLDNNTDEKDMQDIINDPKYDENGEVIAPGDDKDNPKAVEQEIYMNNSPSFRTYLTYKHMLKSTKEYITNKNGNSNVRLRVMAKLSTSDYTVSPAINSIKIVGE